ncbi:MAG: hypothetical protein QOG50_2640, partial [Actinomycetota bacterium]|nr:hypothetical protein [Actinomycetota bacterium]
MRLFTTRFEARSPQARIAVVA